jgi:iron complex outermembrane receptor protein
MLPYSIPLPQSCSADSFNAIGVKGGYFESNFVDYANPVAVMEQNQNDNTLKRINVQGSAEYEIIKGLKFW